ncbi:hypothetical protein D5S17_36205 [Pseudonocardiaceae bacterium YIM PH 21723]|nr:hypothetical protein D5S17_36205 [Pseudonocardiaceae bacterium YIM PH 21723]
MTITRAAPARAEAAWSTLAPLLAARRSVRLWSPGVGFDQARTLGRRLPDRPAAIPIFDARGRTTLLALDFDPQHHGREQVIRDSEQAAQWIREAGGRLIMDESTRGGRHVLIPLAAHIGLPVRHLRPVLDELARRLPTLDITPMTNLSTGCITAPGSPCKQGGHRQLLTPLSEATDAATLRSAPGTIARLSAVLQISCIPTKAAPAAEPTDLPLHHYEEEPAAEPSTAAAAVTSSSAALPPVILAFAEHGELPARRTRRGEPWTRSEARQSVLAHAALRGMTLDAVLTTLAAGHWPGLRAAYERYGASWERSLKADWKKALTWANKATSNSRLSAHQPKHTGGQQGLKEWLARAERWTMLCQLLDGQTRWTTLALWQALAYGAQLTGTTTVAHGRRWLAIAAGLLSDETVSTMLRVLRDIPGSPILLIEKGTGTQADRYALVTPRINGHEVPVDPAILDRTTIDPVHPAWSVIGLPARQIYEALDRAADAGQYNVRPQDLAEDTGMSPTQTYQALIRLAEFNLVDRGYGWARRTTRTLIDIATEHATDDLRAERIARHRAERQAWHDLLALWNGETTTDCPDTEQLPSDPWLDADRQDYLTSVLATGPPQTDELPHTPLGHQAEPDQHTVDLLVSLLGARVVQQTSDLQLL